MTANILQSQQQDQYHAPPLPSGRAKASPQRNFSLVLWEGFCVQRSCLESLGHGMRRAGDNLGQGQPGGCQPGTDLFEMSPLKLKVCFLLG